MDWAALNISGMYIIQFWAENHKKNAVIKKISQNNGRDPL
jgi:hypothetical protein